MPHRPRQHPYPLACGCLFVYNHEVLPLQPAEAPSLQRFVVPYPLAANLDTEFLGKFLKHGQKDRFIHIFRPSRLPCLRARGSRTTRERRPALQDTGGKDIVDQEVLRNIEYPVRRVPGHAYDRSLAECQVADPVDPHGPPSVQDEEDVLTPLVDMIGHLNADGNPDHDDGGTLAAELRRGDHPSYRNARYSGMGLPGQCFRIIVHFHGTLLQIL